MMDYPIGISSVGDQDAINCLLAVHFYHDRHMFRHLILQVKQYTQILRADSIKLSLINLFLTGIICRFSQLNSSSSS